MRLRNHVSLLHIVAISGAAGLALSVVFLMAYVSSSTGEVVQVTQFHQRLGMILTEGGDLRKMLDDGDESATDTTLVLLNAAATRWYIDLIKLQDETDPMWPAATDRAIAPLRSLITRGHRAVTAERSIRDLQEIRSEFDILITRLTQLERVTEKASADHKRTLSSRKRTAIIVIGIFCIIYLAAVEHTRFLTTRRLIRPVEELADVAIQAMAGDERTPHLKQCGTDELNHLSTMLASFVDTLKERVKERTEQLERQKESLEREVAVRRNAEEQLRHAAFHDRLTGLCNRDLLLDRLDQCIQRSRRVKDYRFAVLFLDIDRFKEVNDSLGHSVGDQLLVNVAERLVGCLRSTDTLVRSESNTVARIGGDEFVILLDGISHYDDATNVAERLQETVAAPVVLGEHEIFITASIGITTSEHEYDKPDKLLSDADAAMYHAKTSGKARHELFNESMHEKAMARLELGNDLRRAVENDEFTALYQPVVNLEDGRIAGFEALIRWEHPRRGLVSPLEFLEHTEETGLIVTIGRKMLEHACRQLCAWRDEVESAADLSMSVNISQRQVIDPTIVETVESVLESTGIPGRQLHLEITESVIMANAETFTNVLDRLRKLNVQVHMDDFGTGYSSLSCLHRFPLDVVKIDREFMSSMDLSSDYRSVVQTVVMLAHNLDMKVIVEGVESQQQLEQLKLLQCDYAQGFYLSKPLEASAARVLIDSPADEWLKTLVA
ncbi:MAG: hypothetical protein CMJ18_24990 [Phycisphaeraceae bacterium]|nr:hypothetical protein [Phycisphaeraceae bacterium]